MKDIPQLEPDTIIDCDFARFRIKKLLGKGGFGAVYLVEETSTLTKYAVKTELVPVPGKDRFEPRLLWEETILLAIQALPNPNHKKHFIKVVDRGNLPPLRFMLMTLVGKSLQDLKKAKKSQCFSHNTCWRVALQTLEALEAFHDAGFVHRDIKPHNYTIGAAGQEDIIFMLDFGLVRCYTGKKYETACKDTPSFAGTLKYCSRSSHYSVYQYPKDDFESWISTILDLHDSNALFWKKALNNDDIKHLKNDLFCLREPDFVFNDCVPFGYRNIIELVGNLTPQDKMKCPTADMQKKPDYAIFYGALEELGKQYSFSQEKKFDWQRRSRANKNSISIEASNHERKHSRHRR
uniref:non-specific serine/threonine protein kinase n=1 Tax=Parastrongyloides trichosuri TaxID=131310 RepID=A0A0N4ZQK4_PARTI